MAENTERTSERAHKAGLFDIRFVIGALMGVYGVILCSQASSPATASSPGPTASTSTSSAGSP